MAKWWSASEGVYAKAYRYNYPHIPVRARGFGRDLLDRGDV
jgi:hypothetical protein